jgi:hypothetical protein
MQVPLHISFEHIGHSDPIEARVREEAKKLEQFHGRITAATQGSAADRAHGHHGSCRICLGSLHVGIEGGNQKLSAYTTGHETS